MALMAIWGYTPLKKSWCVNEATDMATPSYISSVGGNYPPLDTQHIS